MPCCCRAPGEGCGLCAKRQIPHQLANWGLEWRQAVPTMVRILPYFWFCSESDWWTHSFGSPVPLPLLSSSFSRHMPFLPQLCPLIVAWDRQWIVLYCTFVAWLPLGCCHREGLWFHYQPSTCSIELTYNRMPCYLSATAEILLFCGW